MQEKSVREEQMHEEQAQEKSVREGQAHGEQAQKEQAQDEQASKMLMREELGREDQSQEEQVEDEVEQAARGGVSKDAQEGAQNMPLIEEHENGEKSGVEGEDEEGVEEIVEKTQPESQLVSRSSTAKLTRQRQMSRTQRQTDAEEQDLDAREESVSSNDLAPESSHEDEGMVEDHTDKAPDDDEIHCGVIQLLVALAAISRHTSLGPEDLPSVRKGWKEPRRTFRLQTSPSSTTRIGLRGHRRLIHGLGRMPQVSRENGKLAMTRTLQQNVVRLQRR